jgi:hypothetical protein
MISSKEEKAGVGGWNWIYEELHTSGSRPTSVEMKGKSNNGDLRPQSKASWATPQMMIRSKGEG